jgi:demethylmenaquinone methyltransferase/2-methoxy-6-polyprenyl-1,4-benzoquinol methylase
MTDTAEHDAALLKEQIEYYRARAPEYDNWWERQAQYALSGEDLDAWESDRNELANMVDGWLPPGGTALELACGTGIWTARLADRFDRVVAIDTAPETIALARAKLRGPAAARVEFVCADIFGWTPPPGAQFDVVFFSFWISHVPPARFADFWRLVDEALARPGGRALFLDNKWQDGVWPPPDASRDDYVQLRTDLTGSGPHRIVKRYYDPDELEHQLTQLGWTAEVTATPRFFIAGYATR